MAITREAIIINGGTADGSGNVVIDITSLAAEQDDLLVVGIASTTTDVNRDFSASGNNTGSYTERVDSVALTGTRDTNLGVYIGVQGATPDTSVTISGVGASARAAWFVARYSGVDTSSPIDGSPGVVSQSGSSNCNPPVRGSTFTGDLFLAIYAASMDASHSWTAPANVSNFQQADDLAAGGGAVGARIGIGEGTGSSFDPDTATNPSSSASDSWIGVTIALAKVPPTQLTAPLLTNTQTFFAPTVTGGADIGVPLLANEQTFYPPTVTPGEVTLGPSLVENTQVFYEPTFLIGMSVPLLANDNGAFCPTVTNDRSWVRNRRRRAKQIDYEMPIRRNIRR